MNKYFRENIQTDNDVYETCKGRDKNIINTMALFTPVSSFIAGYAVYYCINYFASVRLIAIFLGLLIGIGFYNHDSSLLGEFKRGSIYGRLVISFFLVFILMVPVKVDMMGEDVVISKMAEETEEHNLEIHKEFLAKKGEIEAREESFRAKVTTAGKNFDLTGKSQQLIDARRELKAFESRKKTSIEELELHYDGMKKEPKTSKTSIASYYFLNMFNTDDYEELFFDLLILILALLLETSPVLLRVVLNDGEYMRKKEEAIEYNNRINDKRRKLKEKLLSTDGLFEIANIVAQISFWKEIGNEANKDFSDPKKVTALIEKRKEIFPDEMDVRAKSDKNHIQNGNKPDNDDDDFPELEYTT